MWKLQVLSALGGAQLDSFIESTATAPEPLLEPVKSEEQKEAPKPNPEYASWVAKDKQVLSFILMSCSKEILGQIPTSIKSAREAWTVIEGMFGS